MFNRSSAASIKNFKICLDALPNGSTLYYPGDSVQGAVIFAVSTSSGVSDDQASPAKLRCISMSFKGVSVFRAKESCVAPICHQVSYLKLPEGCDTVPTDPSDGSLLPRSLPTGLLAPGQYAIPFSFTIPKDAPGSTTQYQAPMMRIEVSYTLEAQIHLVGALDKKSSARVHVSSVMSQEQHSMERSHALEFPATLPMSSVFGSNGVVEVKAQMKGRVLVNAQKDQGLSISVQVNACGNKTVDGATVELQSVTQIDHWRKGLFSHYEKQYQDREGDLRYCNKFRTLVPSKRVVADVRALELNRPEYEHSGMGTTSSGYVVTNGVPLGTYSFARKISSTKLVLKDTSGSACNGSTKLPPGSSGTFVGTVMLHPRELALPSLRLDKIQRNYRVIIRLGGVAKSICLPVVVVSDVVSNQQQETEGFQLPWMHHEKVSRTLSSHEKVEVQAPVFTPTSSANSMVAEGRVVTDDEDHRSGTSILVVRDDDDALPSYSEAILGSTDSAEGKISLPPPPAYGVVVEQHDHHGLSSSSSEDDTDSANDDGCHSAHRPTSVVDDEVAAYYRSLGYN